MKYTGHTPILSALVKNYKLKAVPFHMPGHKKGRGLSNKFRQTLHTMSPGIDVTEIPGLDDLHNPGGPIREAQDNAARLFGAEETFFLVNGTTVGIHAATMALCRESDTILLPRDVHRSVIGACILTGVKPCYLPLRMDRKFVIPLPPTAEDVAKELNNNPKIKAVFQVYPNYYGLANQLTAVVKAAHKLNIPVIVDEAHGAHFAFSASLPSTAMEAGADVSIQSTHKTLSALTQASMLHIKGKIVDRDELARQLTILQSTSPSYILMASLDAVVGQMAQAGQSLVTKAVSWAVRAVEKIDAIPGFNCLRDLGKSGFHDPTKVFISVRGLGLTGFAVAELLLKKHRVQVEFADRSNILCMISIGTTAEDIRQLVNALKNISVERLSEKREFNGPKHSLYNWPSPRVVLTPRVAWFAPRETVSLPDAVGRIAAEMVAPYPPGVPVLCPGEEVTDEIVALLKCLAGEGYSFHGPGDPTLRTINVVK